MGRIHSEKIEASVIYRDPKWVKHIVDMLPEEIKPSIAITSLDSGIKQSNNNDKSFEKTRKDGTLAGKNNQTLQDNDVAKMYDAYLRDIKSRKVDIEKKDGLIPSNNSQRTGNEDRKIIKFRGMTPPPKKKTEKKKPERNNKKLLISALFAVVILIPVLYYVVNNSILMGSIGLTAPTGTEAAESVTTDFLNAVNDSDFDTAFGMCQGKNFLAVASVEMIFNNKGIEKGSIRETCISSEDYADGIVLVYAECTVAISEPYGERLEVMPIFFLLQDSGQGWAITQIVIAEPGENVDLQAI